MGRYINCPVCNLQFLRIKHHLVAAHGYRYTADSPSDPLPPPLEDKS